MLTAAALLVLLHGRGGKPRDLARVWAAVPAGWECVSLRGPVPCGAGSAWFTVPPQAGPAPRSEHLADAADALVAWVDRHAPRAVTGLVGFSQGGALALHAMRRHPDRFVLGASFCGFTTVDAERGDDELARRRPPFLWSRGALDDVIPDADVRRMADFLPRHTTLEHRVHPSAGHEVTEEMAQDLAAFLGSGPGARLPGWPTSS